ncbi:MAG: hypothetical protein LBS03_05980 [Bacteroidales bacterium]|jgi:hypothetical protein|nr:hypothetical protein [Bacteroidales bacterium]
MTENKTVKTAFPAQRRPEFAPDFGNAARMSAGCIHYKSNGRRSHTIPDKLAGNGAGLQSSAVIAAQRRGNVRKQKTKQSDNE